MIINIFILFLYGLAQEWINYTNYNSVYEIMNQQDVLWIATHGGLVKFIKQSEEIEYYNRANSGIPDNFVNSLAMDSTGNIWIGTHRYGIGKFDGINFTVFNTNNSELPHDRWNNVLVVDKQGIIWVGSSQYLSKYDGVNWSVYDTGDPISSYVSLNDIKFGNQGMVWIAASWGLGRFQEDSLIKGYAGIAEEVNCIVFDKNETMWLGTVGSGLIKFDGMNTTVYDTTNSDIPSNIVYSAKIDSKNIIWLATAKGLASFDGESWKVNNTENSGLVEDVIFALEIDELDKIWLGLMSKGLMSYDRVKFKSILLSSKEFPSNSVYAIAFDKNKSALIGTNKGLVTFDYNSWLLYDSSNSGLNNPYILSLGVDRFNTIWIGARGYHCLTKFDGADWYVYDSTNSVMGIEEVRCLQFDSLDSLWIGSTMGITKYDGENWLRYTTGNTPLTSNGINDIAFDKEGNAWFALAALPFLEYTGGLAEFDGGNWQIYNTGNSGLPIDHVVALAFDSEGALWIATGNPGTIGIDSGGGLTKFDGENWTTYTIYNSGLTSNTIFDILVDSVDHIWIGTYAGGLVRFDRKDEWLVYNTITSGISSNNVSVINIDAKGNKWIGHLLSGISVFREGGVIISEIPDNHPSILKSFILDQNYPNPFNPSTTIGFTLSKPEFVELKIYNLLGQELLMLVSKRLNQGNHTYTFDGTNLASGVYYYQLMAGDPSKGLSRVESRGSGQRFREVKKMILLK